MNNKFKNFIEELSVGLDKNLLGYESHKKMLPFTNLIDIRQPLRLDNIKDSAVLILFFMNNNNISIVLIQRPEYDGVHSGQISFPGGKKEKYDKTLFDTAVREAKEEIGIIPENIKVIGSLSKIFVPPSMFNIFPVVAYSNVKPDFVADINEVKDIGIIKLNDLLSNDSKSIIPIYKKGLYVFDAPAYVVNGYKIWGATAMIISELIDVINESELNKIMNNY